MMKKVSGVDAVCFLCLKAEENHKMNMNNELLNNLEQLHTTELGIERIKRNLSLETDDVIEWCKNKISSEAAVITRNGKMPTV